MLPPRMLPSELGNATVRPPVLWCWPLISEKKKEPESDKTSKYPCSAASTRKVTGCRIIFYLRAKYPYESDFRITNDGLKQKGYPFVFLLVMRKGKGKKEKSDRNKESVSI